MFHESTHTPGPWEVFRRGEGSIYLMSKTNQPSVCIARIFTDEPDDGEANARLIAAAPDLLDALIQAKQTIKAWHEIEKGTYGEDDSEWKIYERSAPEIKRINAAIEKATLSSRT